MQCPGKKVRERLSPCYKVAAIVTGRICQPSPGFNFLTCDLAQSTPTARGVQGESCCSWDGCTPPPDM